jgi:hypothetical protein
MNAVSCRRQFPHMRHPNMGPLVQRSTFRSTLFPKGSFLKGKKGGCHLLPGVNKAISQRFTDFTDIMNFTNSVV